jgi:hypothetical protein
MINSKFDIGKEWGFMAIVKMFENIGGILLNIIRKKISVS